MTLAEPTHSPVLLADVYFDLGTAEAGLGDSEKSAAAYGEALALYEAKENLVMAERTRQKLADLEELTAR